MLAADGFWQTTWPIIAAPLFLILGYFGTFLTNSQIEDRKYKRDVERRTFEWQRESLIGVQEAAFEVDQIATVHWNRIWGADESARPTDPSEAIAPETWQAGRRATAVYVAYSSRIVDDETRQLADAYAERIDLYFESPDLDTFGPNAEAMSDSLQALHARVGELLRTTYA